MTPRERFLAFLKGETPDRLPLLIWDNKLYGDNLLKQLIELEVLIVNKSSVWHQYFEDIQNESKTEPANDGTEIRITTFQTPAGVLETKERIMPGTIWIEEYLFSNANDFDALEAFISNRKYDADFEKFINDDTELKGNSIARPVTIHSPMHELIYEYMGIENFCIQWSENRERVLRLNDILKNDWQRRVELVAASPAKYAVIEGNTEICVVGTERFEKYYLPNIEEGCEILHEKNIIVGGHFDGNNAQLAPWIAKTSLDFIESFTPPPDCDLRLDEALKLWPEKILQLHFPSSVHLGGIDKIRSAGLEILKQVGTGNRISIGVSEDVINNGKDTLVPMYHFFRDNGNLPINL
jgi:hypothetical protein